MHRILHYIFASRLALNIRVAMRKATDEAENPDLGGQYLDSMAAVSAQVYDLDTTGTGVSTITSFGDVIIIERQSN